MTNQEFIESICLPNEEWRDVVGYEGYYMVSSFGRIASMFRQFRGRRSVTTIKFRILKVNIRKPKVYSYTVATVSLCGKTHLVSRIVAEAFLGQAKDNQEVDHIDGNTINNNVINLKWCSHKENMLNPITRQRRSAVMGGRTNTKKSIAVVSINPATNEIKEYPSIAEARRMGFHDSMISKCCKGKRKTHHGFKWMYLSDYIKLSQIAG